MVLKDLAKTLSLLDLEGWLIGQMMFLGQAEDGFFLFQLLFSSVSM